MCRAACAVCIQARNRQADTQGQEHRRMQAVEHGLMRQRQRQARLVGWQRYAQVKCRQVSKLCRQCQGSGVRRAELQVCIQATNTQAEVGRDAEAGNHMQSDFAISSPVRNRLGASSYA